MMKFSRVLRCLTPLAFGTVLLTANGAFANESGAIADIKPLNQLDRLDIRQSQLDEAREALQERIDKLAKQIDSEEARAFSPTTKLSGEVSFALTTSSR
jgi:predicted ATP-grasp superfamily ATP-dependent carboligase